MLIAGRPLGLQPAVAAPEMPKAGTSGNAALPGRADAYDNNMPLDLFHPLVADWFADRFGEPTDPQRRGWPEIAAGRNTLIAAPTGSGKTLAAFLVCLDRLVRRWLDGTLDDQTYVVYVSPLKALGNDIHRNLEVPLAELGALAEAAGDGPLPIRAGVRTGDTPAARAAGDAPPPAAHPGHHARVALPAAHLGQEPRAAATRSRR